MTISEWPTSLVDTTVEMILPSQSQRNGLPEGQRRSAPDLHVDKYQTNRLTFRRHRGSGRRTRLQRARQRTAREQQTTAKLHRTI